MRYDEAGNISIKYLFDKENYLYGKIDTLSVTHFFTDDIGNKIKEETTTLTDDPSYWGGGYNLFTYDSLGRIIGNHIYTKDNESHGKIEYIYSIDGYLSEIISFSNTGVGSNFYNISYHIIDQETKEKIKKERKLKAVLF